jgi:hypothetical protein
LAKVSTVLKWVAIVLALGAVVTAILSLTSGVPVYVSTLLIPAALIVILLGRKNVK